MEARVAPEFSHIRDWVFDLDNCLYPASSGLFALIDERMTDVGVLSNEAARLITGDFADGADAFRGVK